MINVFSHFSVNWNKSHRACTSLLPWQSPVRHAPILVSWSAGGHAERYYPTRLLLRRRSVLSLRLPRGVMLTLTLCSKLLFFFSLKQIKHEWMTKIWPRWEQNDTFLGRWSIYWLGEHYSARTVALFTQGNQYESRGEGGVRDEVSPPKILAKESTQWKGHLKRTVRPKWMEVIICQPLCKMEIWGKSLCPTRISAS